MALPSRVDFLVVGAGVAGLRAAVELADHGTVLVVTKESVGESNTHYAQGGIAVAGADESDLRLHLEDTIAAGDGLVYRPAAEVLVTEGPGRVAELIGWGANFDSSEGELLRTREGAHSLARILHANGDATGAEIGRSLAVCARDHGEIRFAEWTTVTGLITDDGAVPSAVPDSVRGLEMLDREGHPCRVGARSVLLATGGAGQVYSDTTNPPVATGDGIALAAEAGAELADMEFYQFHPTALSLPGAPRFLLSEALRGEGAWLVNDRGERFMERYHPLLELAPRDVVARAIAREAMGESPAESRTVYLDMRQVKGIDPAVRFPGITAQLARYGLDLARDLVPVRPAAHYLMGGIRTDLDGHTSLRGLYAAGEAACTGVHGANRLASNSLLEGLVFGARAAAAMLADDLPPAPVEDRESGGRPLTCSEESSLGALIRELGVSMWAHAGLLRDEAGLGRGLSQLAVCAAGLAGFDGARGRRLSEARALCRVAQAILRAGLARTESRGAHFRSDYPGRDDAGLPRHSVVVARGADEARVRFESW